MLFALRLTFADKLTLSDWDTLDANLKAYLPDTQLAGSASTRSRSSLVLSFRSRTKDAAEARLAPLCAALEDALGIAPEAHLA